MKVRRSEAQRRAHVAVHVAANTRSRRFCKRRVLVFPESLDATFGQVAWHTRALGIGHYTLGVCVRITRPTRVECRVADCARGTLAFNTRKIRQCKQTSHLLIGRASTRTHAAPGGAASISEWIVFRSAEGRAGFFRLSGGLQPLFSIAARGLHSARACDLYRTRWATCQRPRCALHPRSRRKKRTRAGRAREMRQRSPRSAGGRGRATLVTCVFVQLFAIFIAAAARLDLELAYLQARRDAAGARRRRRRGRHTHSRRVESKTLIDMYV